MNTRNWLLKSLLIGACAVGLTATALPKDKGKDKAEQIAVREALQRGEVLPLAKILEIATREVPGEVIKVELEFEGKKPKDGQPAPARILIYEIKVLTSQGRVRELDIDARTGTVIKIEDD